MTNSQAHTVAVVLGFVIAIYGAATTKWRQRNTPSAGDAVVHFGLGYSTSLSLILLWDPIFTEEPSVLVTTTLQYGLAVAFVGLTATAIAQLIRMWAKPPE